MPAPMARLFPLLLVVWLGGCGNDETSERHPVLKPVPTPSSDSRLPGEYLLQARDATVDADELRRLFAPYGVLRLEPLGEAQWRIRLQRDPGPDVLSALAASTDRLRRIQPNYRYRQQSVPSVSPGR